jgi:fatty-acid peroxygenase
VLFVPGRDFLPVRKHPGELCGELTAMIENSGAFGPRSWYALLLRRRAERFVRSLVERVRADQLKLPDSAPLGVVSKHKERDGKLLDINDATVEVLNLLRPVVAVGRYMMFAAMALDQHPEWRVRFAAGEEDNLGAFAEEVRRLYPFFPFIGGRAREAFDWEGYSFRTGEWVLLDLYGTKHDARRFRQPGRFLPERDISWKGQGFDFIPQGGGEAAAGHRCPGEAMTVELMKESLRLLTREMTYEVPEQDLTLDLSRMPTKPKSGFVLNHVQRMSAPVGPRDQLPPA